MISGILEMLDGNLSNDEQLKHIELLLKESTLDPSIFLCPGEKRHWANAALVLLIMGPEKTTSILDGLFEWIQDLNWPGAEIIMELLLQYPKDVINPMITKMLEKAKCENDDNWYDNIKLLTCDEWRIYIIASNHIRHREWR